MNLEQVLQEIISTKKFFEIHWGFLYDLNFSNHKVFITTKRIGQETDKFSFKWELGKSLEEQEVSTQGIIKKFIS